MIFTYLTLGFWLILTAYWLNAARTNSQTSIVSEIFPLLKLIGSASLIYLPCLVGGILAFRLYPYNFWTGAAGTLIVAAGVCLAMWGRAALGKNWSGRVMLQQMHHLVTDGPYGLVRHPIYLGVLLAMLGSCLVLGQIFGFAYFVLSVFGLEMKSEQEEALLAKQFPNEFPQYKQRVRMLFPYLY